MQHPSKPRRPRIARLIAAHLAAGVLATAIAGAVGGNDAAWAAALGAASFGLPQMYMVWRALGSVSRGADSQDARTMLGALYRGEAIKLAGIAVFLIAVFRLWPEVPPLALVLGFIAVQSVHLFAPLLLDDNP